MTNFITPLGKYCFKRLPLSITSAPEIFQRKVFELLQGHEGMVVYMDDILIFGETHQINMTLKRVMETRQASIIKLYKDKWWW